MFLTKTKTKLEIQIRVENTRHFNIFFYLHIFLVGMKWSEKRLLKSIK